VGRGAGRGGATPGLAPDVAAKQARWVGQVTRSVAFRGPLPPPDCYLRDPRASAACLDRAPPGPRAGRAVTAVATYQPLPYLLPAALLPAAGDAGEASRLARLATAAPALVLLAAAAWALASGAALLGLIVAVTPMVLFSAATLNGSGLEIAAGIAFAAALVRLARDGGAPRGAWALAGVAGATLALSRSTGPAWLLVLLAIVPALAGTGGSARVLRAGGRAAALAGAAVAAGVLGNRAWEAAHGPEVIVSLADPRSALLGGLGQLAHALPELVGRFGYLEFNLPLPVVAGWAALAAALLAGALRAAPPPRRLALAAAVAAGAALPVALYVLVVRHTGFGLQGRHVLPVLVALPLLAGELLARRPPPARAALAAGVVAGLAHLGAWWANARRAATGTDGPIWFPGVAEWSPPAGWLPWALLALSGAALVAHSARVTLRG